MNHPSSFLPFRIQIDGYRFIQEQGDVFGRLGLFEKTAERIVAELPRDVLQGAQVVAGPVGGKSGGKQVDRLAVQAGEIDAGGTDRHRADQAIDAGCLVWNCHAPADAGAAQLFALQNRFDKCSRTRASTRLASTKRLDDLADGPFLLSAVILARIPSPTDKVGKLHALISLLRFILRFPDGDSAIPPDGPAAVAS